MDDTCAVCVNTLEWVAYGSCGHKEVCSTCVARLRFICSDRRCCICKTESTITFVTKAMGDYTMAINDFKVFPSEGREGRSGSYWYHEDTQCYFDDFDQYKMIKEMCRVSCSVCDKLEVNTCGSGSKIKAEYRDIHQLKGHLLYQHELLMCNLCLEGRKVFICEQKLYNKAQLEQHINTGDSEVDGTESERGGFQGHPLCEFCRSPFYGDSELYKHMETEHYHCFICKRQNPSKYEYYKNYDDLEIHYRQEHFLCEDESCLSKKFIVFVSESEMKRHNALEHGGHMSRSRRNAALQVPRNAALQLPTSFTFRRSNEQDNSRGNLSTNQPSSSSGSNHTDINGVIPLIQPFIPHLPSLSSQNTPRPWPWPNGARFNNHQPVSNTGSMPLCAQKKPIKWVQAQARARANAHSHAQAPPSASSSSSSSWKTTSRISHSTSAPNLVPPLSTNGASIISENETSSKSVDEEVVADAKRSMVEKIRAGLGNDPDRYTAFKKVCGEYRHGVIDTETYLVYVDKFRLSHLVPDLARFLPDPVKEKELTVRKRGSPRRWEI